MNNLIIFIKHAETKIDEKVPISKWNLSEKGLADRLQLLTNSFFSDVEIIITSNEKKAFITAQPLAVKLKLKVLKNKEINELNRDKSIHLTKEEYDRTVEQCLTHRNNSYNNWEKANDALQRFSKEIRKIDLKYNNKKILIVSHGLILTLFFSHRLNKYNQIFQRWKETNFLDYGILKNNKIIKDIISKTY